MTWEITRDTLVLLLALGVIGGTAWLQWLGHR